jgi:CDP-diacylglycerol pyrophosphatase
LRRGFALVKDAGGPTGYLLVPTRRLSGIEDPALLTDDAPNYWQLAWSIRELVERKASRKLDRTDIGIAVNSLPGRSQNQLHFHIDCVRQDVKESLRSVHPMPDGSWTELNLLGHPYRVTTIEGDDLGSRNPFKLMPKNKQGSAKERSEHTLAVVGAGLDGRPGFYMIEGSVGPKTIGHGEELLDHRCKLNEHP